MPTELLADFFDNTAAWQVIASGQAEGKLTREKGTLRLDYDFHGGGGFVVARREIRFSIPETFAIAFNLRGVGLSNHFEFKVADPSGANAWRHQRLDYQLPADWIHYRITERELPFAWGPAGGGGPHEVAAVEFVVAAGPGGRGSLWLSDLTLDDETPRTPLQVTSSGHLTNYPPLGVFSGKGWRAVEGKSPTWWAVDYGRSVRFGGLVLDWPKGFSARNYAVEISADGENWKQVHRASHTSTARSHIAVADGEARHFRLVFFDSSAAVLDSFTLKPDVFSHTPNEFIHAVAADFPRGWYPRYWHREQSYWTPVGSPEGRRRALINEEGMVETDEAGFSLEPFLQSAGKLITWADVEITVALAEGGLPLPVVTWNAPGICLKIMPWVDGEGNAITLRVQYQLECEPQAGVLLVVTARPFQVNPPWQAFRNLGGHSPITHVECKRDGLLVNDHLVFASHPPDSHGAAGFQEGGVLSFLSENRIPMRQTVEDDSGLASAAMAWRVPDGATDYQVVVSVPFFSKSGDHDPHAPHLRSAVISEWYKMLEKVEWTVPRSATTAFDCFRTAAAHILINRDGPAIQPGPRRYTRSWVRDCVIMGAALAKSGSPHALEEFIRWYVGFQRNDGFIPCVVDRDGVDWLVEHDSHGQFLWGIREVFRNGGGIDFLETLRPAIKRTADFMLHLRAERKTSEFTGTAVFGLFPESASHEGYLAHPVHSYWDDFWGIRGLQAGAEIAKILGMLDDSILWTNEAADFTHDVMKSLDKVIAEKNLNYIPGSVEWADFDPTATSNAIAMLDFADELPANSLNRMLETYLDGFRKKHRGDIPWNNYTAYEIRIIGAFVRLGKREEAHELLNFFLSDRRPLEWNQWPEITWRDPRAPGHLGDVPHTWIAAEYLLALASMVASERENTDSLVLAAGLSWAWISQENGFSVRGLPTRHGPLDFQIKADGVNRISLRIGELITLPPGGLTISPPVPMGLKITAATDDAGRPLVIERMGLSVTVEYLPLSASLLYGETIA